MPRRFENSTRRALEHVVGSACVVNFAQRKIRLESQKEPNRKNGVPGKTNTMAKLAGSATRGGSYSRMSSSSSHLTNRCEGRPPGRSGGSNARERSQPRSTLARTGLKALFH